MAASSSRMAWPIYTLTGTLSNLGKHGVSFDEASTVFDDPLAVIFDDEAHSTDEVRELIIGHSVAGRLLLVSFTELPDSILRLISARTATKKERQAYEEFLDH